MEPTFLNDAKMREEVKYLIEGVGAHYRHDIKQYLLILMYT